MARVSGVHSQRDAHATGDDPDEMNKVVVMCSGSCSTFVGWAGDVAPKMTFQKQTALSLLLDGNSGGGGTTSSTRLTQPSSSGSVFGEKTDSSGYATTTPLSPPRNPPIDLKDRPLLITVPVTMDRSEREDIVEAAFNKKHVSSVFLLLEPVACSYATGVDQIRVVDFGSSNLTVSFVDQGQVTKFAASASLGCTAVNKMIIASEIELAKQQGKAGSVSKRGVLGVAHKAKDKAAEFLLSGQTSENENQNGEEGEKADRAPEAKKKSVQKSKAPKTLHSLLGRLPDRATDAKLLLVGGGMESPFAVETIREAFPNDDAIAFTKPSQTCFTGASLFGSLEGCVTHFIPRAQFAEQGKAVVHWSCPE